MGKCSRCGKRIEYNNFVVVDGIVYHKECAPKKEADPKTVKAEKEATEQFLKDMAEVSEMKEIGELDIQKKLAEEEELKEKKEIPKCDISNKIYHSHDGETIVPLKKPRKKRSKKND